MTALLGTNLSSLIVPFDSADTYPTHDSFYGLGGWREVASTTIRDAIPTARLRAGMIVYVQGDQAYQWTGSAYIPYKITPANLAIGMFFPGTPTISQFVLRLEMVVAATLPVGLTGSKFAIRVNPTATMVFTLAQNGTTIGTVTFSTAGAPTVSFTTLITFAIGDIFSIQGPSPVDTTGADISMTFLASL